MTSIPVASPWAWTTRRWLWPPSRPSSSCPSRESNAPPQSISSRMRSGPSDTTSSTEARSQSPRPATRVSSRWAARIVVRQHGGDAPLGIVRVALAQRVLGHHQHAAGSGRLEGGAIARDAAADHQRLDPRFPRAKRLGIEQELGRDRAVVPGHRHRRYQRPQKKAAGV